MEVCNSSGLWCTSTLISRRCCSANCMKVDCKAGKRGDREQQRAMNNKGQTGSRVAEINQIRSRALQGSKAAWRN
jgi:hypothetical protein